MSRICSSSLMSLTDFTVAVAVSENSVATRTSVGTGISQIVSRRLASSTRLASYRDLPTLLPCAATKVFAIPPPTISLSAILDRESSTVSLVETLEPPTIATIGRAGLFSALPSASSSADSSGPAQAIGANLPTPWVEACAVRGTECVHHIDVTQLSVFLRQRFVVFLFAFVKANVFQNNQFAFSNINAVQIIFSQTYRVFQMFFQVVNYWQQRKLFVVLAFCRTTQMRGNHHACALFQGNFDGWQ